MPRPKAAAPLLWWRAAGRATFVVAMNRVDVVDLVVDLVDVDLDVDLVDVDLVDVDLVDVDLVDVDLERAIDKKEITRFVVFVCVALRAASILKNRVISYLIKVLQVTKYLYLSRFEHRECLSRLSFEK